MDIAAELQAQQEKAHRIVYEATQPAPDEKIEIGGYGATAVRVDPHASLLLAMRAIHDSLILELWKQGALLREQLANRQP